MYISRTGQLMYDTALGVYNYLVEETEYVPWAAAINNLSYLKGMFARTGGYGALKVRDPFSKVCRGTDRFLWSR